MVPLSILHHCSPFILQLIYLIIITVTGAAAIPVISLAMIAAVYGLQVGLSLSIHRHVYLTINGYVGTGLHLKARVHACRLDGGLHHIVWAFPTVFSDRSPSYFRYPVYSFFLPVYSFWCMDDFGWGNTRLVIGEGKDKKVVINDDEKYDESMIPLKKFSGKQC